MCIRDRVELLQPEEGAGEQEVFHLVTPEVKDQGAPILMFCLLYTSDAADERSSVDLGGRRIIKKKKKLHNSSGSDYQPNRPTK